MDDFISREEALSAQNKSMNLNEMRERLKRIPAADVRPVVRGKFEDAMQSCHDSPHVKCSVCGEYYWRYFNKFNFCPNCGADMRETEDEKA